MRKVNIIRFFPELLASFLNLPEDAKILGCRVDFDSGAVDFKFTSRYCYETFEGYALPYITLEKLEEHKNLELKEVMDIEEPN